MPFHVMNFQFAEYYLVDFIVWENKWCERANTNRTIVIQVLKHFKYIDAEQMQFYFSYTTSTQRQKASQSFSQSLR